ncbi:peptidyl-glycine alpha-amidating monooxygenase [Elysia marginata]|uniref:Peptidyl-glycine alpha-amidating monooxygenase n=1 Tax=Elysia marginata TaxID=1093978 RepID=A0AAV4FCA2_9GAST|nr:peptidyl-glycine alpha-amidating monooxygenase [Elysia marginata]
MESYCKYEGDYPIYPVGFRTHAHELGYAISGYRVRDGKWMEIGRMSPQLPQTFYTVSNPGMEIKQGDELASRCTMNSMAREDVTFIGLVIDLVSCIIFNTLLMIYFWFK